MNDDKGSNSNAFLGALIVLLFWMYTLIHPKCLKIISDWLTEHLHIQEILNSIG